MTDVEANQKEPCQRDEAEQEQLDCDDGIKGQLPNGATLSNTHHSYQHHLNHHQQHQQDEYILGELKQIGKACQTKHIKPSMRVVRANLERLAAKLQSEQYGVK